MHVAAVYKKDATLFASDFCSGFFFFFLPLEATAIQNSTCKSEEKHQENQKNAWSRAMVAEVKSQGRE